MNIVEITAIITVAIIIAALIVILLVYRNGKKRVPNTGENARDSHSALLSKAKTPRNDITISAIESLILIIQHNIFSLLDNIRIKKDGFGAVTFKTAFRISGVGYE